MSEEKLYAVKNDEGEYWDFLDSYGFCALDVSDCPTTPSKDQAELVADEHGGHVVELVEKPEPVEVKDSVSELLTRLRRELLHGDSAHCAYYYIDDLNNQHDMSIEDIFHAFDVGWTANPQHLWYVKTPENWMGNEKQGWLFKIGGSICTISEYDREHTADEQFTAEEIDKYHLGDFEKVEVTDDDD